MAIRPAPAATEALHSEVRELAPRNVSHVRSTVVVSSMQALHAAGLGERYEARLPAGARERLLGVGAPCWLPMELAWAHYASCNALGLTDDEILQMGARVAPAQVSGAGLILRAARAGGITPWTLFEQADCFWRRMYDGGRVDVVREGPKDARLVVRGQPLARLRYWRLGLQGILTSLTSALSQRVYVHPELSRSDHDGPPWATYQVSWV